MKYAAFEDFKRQAYDDIGKNKVNGHGRLVQLFLVSYFFQISDSTSTDPCDTILHVRGKFGAVWLFFLPGAVRA